MTIPGSLTGGGGGGGQQAGRYMAGEYGSGSLREGKVYRVLNAAAGGNSGPSSMSYGRSGTGGPMSEDITVRTAV